MRWIFALLFMGCSAPLMLPEGFPLFLGHEYLKEGRSEFLIVKYDTDGNQEADLKVVYYCKNFKWLEDGGFRADIVAAPYKVQRFKMGYVMVEERINNTIEGNRAQIVYRLVDGVWKITHQEIQ